MQCRTLTRDVWQRSWLSVLCEFVCVCVSLQRAVISCLASTHTALVSSPSLTVLHLPNKLTGNRAGRACCYSPIEPCETGASKMTRRDPDSGGRTAKDGSESTERLTVCGGGMCRYPFMGCRFLFYPSYSVLL